MPPTSASSASQAVNERVSPSGRVRFSTSIYYYILLHSVCLSNHGGGELLWSPVLPSIVIRQAKRATLGGRSVELQSWTKIGCSPCQSVRNTCALILRPSGGGSARGVSRAPSWVGTVVDGVSPSQKWTASRATASALRRKIVESSALRDAKQCPEIPELRGAGDEQAVVRQLQAVTNHFALPPARCPLERRHAFCASRLPRRPVVDPAPTKGHSRREADHAPRLRA